MTPTPVRARRCLSLSSKKKPAVGAPGTTARDASALASRPSHTTLQRPNIFTGISSPYKKAGPVPADSGPSPYKKALTVPVPTKRVPSPTGSTQQMKSKLSLSSKIPASSTHTDPTKSVRNFYLTPKRYLLASRISNLSC